jgi:hypothetical protein
MSQQESTNVFFDGAGQLGSDVVADQIHAVDLYYDAPEMSGSVTLNGFSVEKNT